MNQISEVSESLSKDPSRKEEQGKESLVKGGDSDVTFKNRAALLEDTIEEL